jgi:hypothetical protein
MAPSATKKSNKRRFEEVHEEEAVLEPSKMNSEESEEEFEEYGNDEFEYEDEMEEEAEGMEEQDQAPEKPKMTAEEKSKQRKEQKELKKDRKRMRKYSDMIDMAKSIWNQIRRRDMDEKERADLLNELMEGITGHVQDVRMLIITLLDYFQA